jgi:molybdate transport system substrate-binding protein
MFRQAICCVLIAGFWLAAGCSRPSTPANQPTEMRILCGSSMATPGQQIAKLFQEKRGAQALVDLGGSETLLPRVLTGAPADIFICHDPFEQKVKDAGFWAGSARVGVLKPVLLVRPGNPLGVKSVNDLTNRNIKLGIGDPRASTCGELFVALLEKKGLSNTVMPQVTMQARAHAELANGLILGPLDAVVVWNFVSCFYTNKVQLVPTDDQYPEINVTVVGLKQSQNPKLRDAFLDYCRSDAVKAIFAEQGYGSRPPGR